MFAAVHQVAIGTKRINRAVGYLFAFWVKQTSAVNS
jgi:hypothetical protein